MPRPAGAQVAIARAVPAPPGSGVVGRPTHGSPRDPVDGLAVVRSAAASGPVRFIVRLAPPARTVGGPPPRDRGARVEATRRLQRMGDTRAGALDGLLSDLARSGAVSAVERFPAFGVVAVTGGRAAIEALARAPGVVAIQADREHHIDASGARPAGRSGTELDPQPSGWNLEAVSAPRAWRELGATGVGATVGVIDTGADWRHPALATQYRGRPGGHHHHWIDLTSPRGSPEPVDLNGHGTHVTGLVTGRLGDVAYGVAPGARWIAAEAFDGDGDSTDAVLLRAAQWMLAPTRLDGTVPRPDLAPDVVNGSWGLDNGADPLFDTVVETWRAAGILAVFAAGNVDAGGGWDTVLAPAGHPLTLAIGAVDGRGLPWWRSRRGPGFHGGVKPDLVAPGVDVVSTWPGGGTAVFDGTSMAAPHAAGAAAVLLGLEPSLTPADLAAFLRAGARDVGPPGPDADTGWGALDVYGAATLALGAGRLAGRVVDVDGDPIAGAVVAAAGVRPAAAPWSATTDGEGWFDIALPAGTWRIAVSAFGHQSRMLSVEIRRDERLAVDVPLPAAPAAVVGGMITSTAGGSARHARVEVAGAVGIDVSADPDGRYAIALPEGLHTLRFAADAHQAVTRTLTAAPGAVITLDVVLPAAPRILFVDADAWDEERIGPYIRRALDDAGYPHAGWAVDRVAALPTAAELAAFDVVIWSHGYNSPGRLDLLRGDKAATNALTAYVAQGGRLLLTGQDVGAFDAATPRRAGLAPEFYRRILGAALVSDVAGGDLRVAGMGPLAGLSLGLAWPGGAEKGRRGVLPDAVAPAPEAAPGTVQPLLAFPDGQLAGLATADADGRRVYLSFGPESAGGRAALARLFDRLIGWLEPPSVAIETAPAAVAPGAAFTVDVAARGGRSAGPVAVDVAPAPGIVLAAGQGWMEGPRGSVAWSGPLGANEARRWAIDARLSGQRRGPGRLAITATLTADAHRAAASAGVQPLAPALDPSSVTIVPPRRSIGGPVTVTLRIANAGPVVAGGAGARLTLPNGITPISGTLAASAGAAAWADGTLRRVEWSGDVAPGSPIAVGFAGRIADVRGATHVLTATLNDGIDQVVTRTATILIGGPDLGATHFADAPSTAVAGAPLSATLRLINVGPVAAQARASMPLPAGISVDGAGAPDELASFAWSGTVEPGATRDVNVRLRVARDAAPGPRALIAAVTDGWSPPTIVRTAVWSVDVRRAVIDTSRIVLWPAAPRSGGVISATLLVANHGDAPAEVEAVDSLAPTLTPLGEAIRAGSGAWQLDPGTLTWRVRVPPANGTEYAPRLGDPAVAPAPGQPVPPADPGTARRDPVRLGLAFPFYGDVYTEAWLTDGLIGFTAPEPPGAARGPDPDGPNAPSIAVRWRPDGSPGAAAAAPSIRRLGDRTIIAWPDAAGNPAAGITAELMAGGRIGLGYGPAADVGGAFVGLHAPDGHTLAVPADLVRAGRTTVLDPPHAWAWLTVPARVGQALDANRAVGHVVRLTAGGAERSFGASTVANRLVLGAGMARWPAQLTAGSTAHYTLTLTARGVVDARDVEVDVDVPDGATVGGAALGPDWAYDPASHTARWRGGVGLGAPRALTWSLRLGSQLPTGARVATHAAVRTRSGSVPQADVWNAARVDAADLSRSTLRASPRVARGGAVITFDVRAVNGGPRAADITVTDALPDGLTYVEGSALASAGAAPAWDGASRSLRWEGRLAPSGAVSLRFQARFSAQAHVVNAMRVTDAEGTAFAAWAEVVPERARVHLPIARRVY